MAIENVSINSGTGPAIAADLVGTNYYQVVKIMQAADGSTGSLSNWTVTPAPKTTVGAGRIVVSSASVAIALTASSVSVQQVKLMALPSNTAPVAFGPSTANASSGGEVGILLYPTQQSELIEVDNLNKLYINATASDQGVSYVYFN